MSSEGFDWKFLQQWVKFTDEELEIFKSDPRRAKAAQRMMGSPGFEKKWLIVEVVSSENCRAKLKPGDRLLFKACSVLDLKRSAPWCIMAMANIDIVAGISHDRWVSGLDLKELSFDHLSCVDCGVKDGGRGRVAMKAYVKDEDEL